MSDAVHISAAPPARTSMSFSALRESGMEWIRLWAKDSWTDHNVHDPGITLLEAFSYAMTELGLRLDLDVADLLRSGEAHAAPQLEPAHRVLPTGPVNAADLRRVLLDHPRVGDVQIFQPANSEVAFFEALTPNPPLIFIAGRPRVRPGGLYEVLVEFAESAVPAEQGLNSNTYKLQVSFDGKTYDTEIALPFWDEPEAAPFRRPVQINTIAMLLDAGGVAWLPLPEEQTYYGKVRIAYTDAPSAPAAIESWVLLRVTTQLSQAGSELPGILSAALTALQDNSATAPIGRFAMRVRGASVAVEDLRAYLTGWRNLCEQPVRIGLVRVQEISVRARLEVGGGVDVEQLLARIYMDIDAALTPRVRFRSLAETQATEADSASIFDGPLLRRGFFGSGGDEVSYPRVIYTSDILHLIMGGRSGGSDLVTPANPASRDIVSVTSLSLGNFINNRPITVDAADCLHMVDIQRYLPRLSIAKSRITCVRNESPVSFDLSRVEALYADLQKQARALSITADPSPVRPVVRGEALPVEDYVPLQMELPATFGVGAAKLPESAGPERHAAAKQLQGYLLVFEQMLGDVTAQVGNINRFFSADVDATPSYFVRPPFDLPGAESLLRRDPAENVWQTFIANPDNSVARALRDAAEDRERLLDRRNRMLDHLLARQGEDAAALGQEIHRWARAELGPPRSPPPPLTWEGIVDERRDAANARLLRHKAALLRDAPELNALRLLANSNPVMSDGSLVRVEPVADQFRWHLSAKGPELLRAILPAASSVTAAIAAERALALSGRASNYSVVDVGGGQFRFNLKDGTGAGAPAIGESTQIFGSAAAADTALTAMAAVFATLRIETSASPLERKLAHYSGIRDTRRRRALTPLNAFFEIVDEPPGGGAFGKRWRLHAPPGTAGAVLLVSPIRYEAPSDAQALALAAESIRKVLRYGLDEWNYRVVAAPGDAFQIELRYPENTLLATHGVTFATAAAAQAELTATVEHLYRTYGAECFHLVEHLLLRPRSSSDALLSLPVSNTARERDPYSQRITIVLPSGSARNFALAKASAPRTDTTPDRFRDAEFRRHFEGMVRRACPAHLLPTIYWVDRELPATASDASYDTFETRYFDWLDSTLIPGATPAAVDLARNRLVAALEDIADDAA